MLIAAAEIDTPIDGLIYGAFIGLGFQIVEDFQYLTNPAFAGNGFSQTHVVWELFLVRGLVGGIWSHAAYTGLVGLGIGYLVSRPDVPRARRIALAVLAFAGAWAMHFVWNSPWLENVLAGGFWRTIIAQSVIKGLPGFLLLAWLYFRARRRESRWVEHVLTPEMATGAVTATEIEALLTFHGRRGERRGRPAPGRAACGEADEGASAPADRPRRRPTDPAESSTPEIDRRRHAIASIRDALRQSGGRS